MRELTIAKVHQLMQEKKLTAVELVEYYLDRIDKYDKKGPKLNSIILINPNAVEEAKKLDEKFAKEGPVGPLHGIPVILKDNCETYDMPTTAGAISLKGFESKKDAFLVKQLRQAGAIILAKSNLHEFAIWGETISSIQGQTLNPYDLTRTPGGSSGGTGAAIAADFGIVGIGTDTINSVRSPSSANSVVGIRPTIGCVSRGGIVPYSMTQDTAGAICRTVEDAARTLSVISGYDPEDEVTAWDFPHRDIDYAAGLEKSTLIGKRIGVLRSFFGKEEINQEVNAVVNAAINQMKAAGAIVMDIKEDINSGWLTSDVSVHLDDFSDHLTAYLQALPADKVGVHSLKEIYEKGLYHPVDKENIETAIKLTTHSPEYDKKILRQAQVRNSIMKIIADYELDAIVYPHQQQLVCKVGSSQKQRNGVLCSVTGFPSVVVPAGFSKPDADSVTGVPIGMEIIGEPWSEKRLIRIAYAFEQATHYRKSPATTPF